MGILDDLKNTVTRSLKNEVGDVVLHRESGTYNVASGTTNTVEISFSGTGFSQSVSEEYMDDNVVDMSSREIVIYQSTLTDSNGNEIEPDQGDEIEVDGERYKSVVIDSEPSQTVWVVVGTQ